MQKKLTFTTLLFLAIFRPLMGQNTPQIQQSDTLQTVEILGRNAISYKNDYTFGATKTGTEVRQLPQSVSSVTKELMADRQMRYVTDAAKSMSGVHLNNYYFDLNIRGFRSSEVRLINGLRSGQFFFLQPSTANLERIEVIKGPASAMFGNTHAGGTLNMITKKPLAEPRTSVSFTTGSFSTYRTALDITNALNDAKTVLYRLNMVYENNGSFRNLQGGTAHTIAPSVSFLPSDKTRLNVDFVLTNTDTKLDRGQPIFGAAANTPLSNSDIKLALAMPNDYYRIRDVSINTSLSHEFSKNISANVSYMNFGWTEDLSEHRHARAFMVDSAAVAVPTVVQMQAYQRSQRLNTQNLTAYLIFKAKTGNLNHQILVGYDYIDQTRPLGGAQNTASGFRNNANSGVLPTFNKAQKTAYLLDKNGAPVPNVAAFDLKKPDYLLQNGANYLFNRQSLPATQYTVQGAYVQDQMRWNKLGLLLSLRQEWYIDNANFETATQTPVKQNALLPRIGINYDLLPTITAYATYLSGYMPQITVSQLNPEAGGPFDPLSNVLFEAGLKGDFFSKKLVATLAVYQIEQNNILVNAGNPQRPQLLEQRGQEVSKGVELELAGQLLPNLSMQVSYAFNETKITKGRTTDVGLLKENAPQHIANAWLKYTISEGFLTGFGVGLGANYVSKRIPALTRTFDLPDYTVADASLYYQINKMRITMNINNLTNERYWLGGQDYFALFPGAPRNWLTTVAYSF
jgi:iron complex outermembrane recepter protein